MSRKIPPELHDEILGRAATGSSTRAISAWLKSEKSISASHVSVASLIRKHRQDRREVAGHIVEAHLEKSLPRDLDVYSRRVRRFGRLYDKATKAAAESPTHSNLEIVAKLAVQLRGFEADKRKALGLEEPDERVADLASLLAKA